MHLVMSMSYRVVRRLPSARVSASIVIACSTHTHTALQRRSGMSHTGPSGMPHTQAPAACLTQAPAACLTNRPQRHVSHTGPSGMPHTQAPAACLTQAPAACLTHRPQRHASHTGQGCTAKLSPLVYVYQKCWDCIEKLPTLNYTFALTL